MLKRLGQNPFENDFRKQNEKYLDLFFKQDKARTSSIAETYSHHDNRKQLTGKQTIVQKSEEKRVYEYLTRNGISTTLDISTALELYVLDAIRILQILERKGMVLKAKTS